MVTNRIRQRSACTAFALAALGAGLISTAPAALAANSIEVKGADTTVVGVLYSCDADAGVAGLKVLVGDPNADRPSAQGTLSAPTCDGSAQKATVTITPAPGAAALASGQSVQVRAALVDKSDTVITGTAAVLTLD